MPSQPARSISSYFAKKSSPPRKTPSSPSTSLNPGSIQIASTSTLPNGTTTTAATTISPEKHTTTTATVSSSPVTIQSTLVTSTSSPAGSTPGKRSFLSDAARKAIAEGMAEGPIAKKAKLDSGLNVPKVADVFLKAAVPAPAKPLKIPHASSLAELRASIAANQKGKELLQLELDTLGEDWLLALQDELTKPYFLALKEFVTKEQATKKVFPPAQDIYSWSRLCPLKDVRVVIVGQDPYHDDGQAHGLAFSVRKGMRIPPSLRNIYKQMATDVPGFIIPKHGDLTEWAKHGVLLLNTSLTVRAHEAASHSGKGWEQFTAAVLKVVTSRLAPTKETTATDSIPGGNGVVFMAWGAHAQKMCAGVDKNKHLILRSVHPSPLAANRGFFGNEHFKKANEWLVERYGPEGAVDWKALGAES